jgi:hypothetical protein
LSSPSSLLPNAHCVSSYAFSPRLVFLINKIHLPFSSDARYMEKRLTVSTLRASIHTTRKKAYRHIY